MEKTNQHPLSHGELLELRRWNTPTIYNGWEQITKLDAGKDGFNPEECRDFMPEMGPMVGYAVTVVIEPSNKEHSRRNPNAWSEYRRYVAESITPLQAVQLQPTVFSQEIWRNCCCDTSISVKLRLDRFADYDIRDGARWISGRNKSVNGWF